MDKRKETVAVKRALKEVGITCCIRHMGGHQDILKVGIKYPPRTETPTGYGVKYTTAEVYLQIQAMRITKEVTGRQGISDGSILIW